MTDGGKLNNFHWPIPTIAPGSDAKCPEKGFFFQLFGLNPRENKIVLPNKGFEVPTETPLDPPLNTHQEIMALSNL